MEMDAILVCTSNWGCDQYTYKLGDGCHSCELKSTSSQPVSGYPLPRTDPEHSKTTQADLYGWMPIVSAMDHLNVHVHKLSLIF